MLPTWVNASGVRREGVASKINFRQQMGGGHQDEPSAHETRAGGGGNLLTKMKLERGSDTWLRFHQKKSLVTDKFFVTGRQEESFHEKLERLILLIVC